MKLFETSKGLKSKLTEAQKDIKLPNSNLYLLGQDRDTNGNSTIRYFFPNQRAFSLQVNGQTLNASLKILGSYDKLDKIPPKDLETIEKEAVDYIKKFGSSQQKSSLKTYGKLKESASESDVLKEKYDKIQKQINSELEWQEKELDKLSNDTQSKVRKIEFDRQSVFSDFTKNIGNPDKQELLYSKYEYLGKDIDKAYSTQHDKAQKIQTESGKKLEELRGKFRDLLTKSM